MTWELSLMNEVDSLSADKDQLINDVSSNKFECQFLEQNKAELEKEIKDLKEHVHVFETESAALKLQSQNSKEI